MRLIVCITNLNSSFWLASHIYGALNVVDVTIYGWPSNFCMLLLRVCACCYLNAEVYVLCLSFDLFIMWAGGDFSADKLALRRAIRQRHDETACEFLIGILQRPNGPVRERYNRSNKPGDRF